MVIAMQVAILENEGTALMVRRRCLHVIDKITAEARLQVDGIAYIYLPGTKASGAPVKT
jgi:hypothetical protein